jgi:IclR family transcriptional regulator, acetate operon repressor
VRATEDNLGALDDIVTAAPAESMPVNATTRVVALLDALIRSPEGTVGVRELAGQLKMSRSATYRFLAVLSEAGYARSLEGGRYQMTARPRAWSHFMRTRHPVLVESEPVMAELAEAAGETVHLLVSTPAPSLGVFVARAEGTKLVQHLVNLGVPTPLTSGAAGKALLATRSPEIIDEVLRGLGPEGKDRAAALRAELAEISEAGYATSRGELMPDVAGVASAFYRFGEEFGALAVSMPAYRFNPASGDLPALVMRAAADLSARFGDPAD